MNMDAQTLIAIAISAGCGLWALWRFIRPLVRPSAHDCGAPPPDLLQIDPAEPQKRQP